MMAFAVFATSDLMAKTLVAYFSATGNTKGVAEKLAVAVDADLFQIEPEQTYTNDDLDWTNDESRASVEMKDETARPTISNKIEDIMYKVKEIAKRFDIDRLLDREAVKLSGGERQRVCIARALVTKPLLVIADEPTASLDRENTDIIINYLKEINKTSTIILASHDDRVIENCDKICCLDDYKGGLLSVDRLLKKLDK